MIDLAIIAANLAHDRVADQFAGPAGTSARPGVQVRRAAVRDRRAVADRLDR